MSSTMFARDPHLDPHTEDCPRVGDDPLGAPCTCSSIEDCDDGGQVPHQWVLVDPELGEWQCRFCAAVADGVKPS